MTNGIWMRETGGPEVLTWGPVEVGDPKWGEVRILHMAIGLNFIDTYHRSGLYPVPLPVIPGLEAAGIIDAVGEGVADFKAGDRVAYGVGPLGAYAEARLIPASRIVKIPDSLGTETAAAMMLKGCTAEYLVRRSYPVTADTTVLFHAAAGGVGLIACQWLKAIGATVIGTAGGPEKCALALATGIDHVIDYKAENFKQKVRRITGGEGVDVVYDSVGKDTFMDSLDCLKRLGMMVSFGNATGMVDPVPPGVLAAKGSLFLTRPSLMNYYVTQEEFASGTTALFDLVTAGKIKISINQRFALKDAADAQRALEARDTTGSTILLP